MTQENKHRPLPMAYIQEHLALCNESPSGLKWITKRAGRGVGPAGGLNGNGYYSVSLEDERHGAHRIVWALHTGQDPGSLFVDHRDGCKTNNRPENLRGVTYKENNQNKAIQSNNKSGVTGVRWVADRARWHARIKQDGRVVSKFFKDITEAAGWISAKRLELFGEFAPENRQGPIENTSQASLFD